MRIATMVRGYIPAPRPADIVYAPLDLSVQIAEGLSARGHEVTYFGPTGTHVGTLVESLNLRPLARNVTEFQQLLGDFEQLRHNVPGLWDQYLAREMFERAQGGKYDLLHFQHFETALPFASMYPEVPVIYTIHDPIHSWIRESYELYASSNQFFISISNNQRIPAPDLPYLRTIYHGVDIDKFCYNADAGDYLLFSGRILPEKGVKEAIQVAQNTDSRLLIIGPTYPDHQDYFDSAVKPHLNDKILYLGYMERENLITYYQKARAILFPIQWEEPFGLTMIEAMSCGTPILAIGRGSVPEIIRDGKTGFIVSSIAEMSTAVANIDQINREACRAHVEKLFSVECMIKNYESAFHDVLKRTKTAPIDQ